MSQKYQLKNGLKVILVESHKSPVVSVQMWVRTGSADEKVGEEGISHFIEHLVFKGTEKFKVGEIASSVEGAGGELNAYTSFDQTVFYVTISKNFMDLGLETISQMMGFPLFEPQEIDNEREVVIEEIKRGEDSPHRQISQLLFSTAYTQHAYRKPVIGYAKNIKKMSAKKITQYFRGRYIPQNMFLVVAGDFETKSAKAKINDYFGSFSKYKLNIVRRKKERAQTVTRVKTKKSTFQETMVYVSFRAPNAKHKDVSVLDVLALIFGQGDSSRLTKSLRIKAPIVNSVGAFSFNPQDEGLFAVSATLKEENLNEFLNILLEEIKVLMSTVPTNEELQKAITILSSEQVYSVESVDGIARKAGSNEFYLNDPEHFKKYLNQIYKVTPEDIKKAALKYINPNKMSISILSPLDESISKKAATLFSKNLKNYLKTRSNKKDKNKIKSENKNKSEREKQKKFKPQKLIFRTSVQEQSPKTEVIELDNSTKLFLRLQKESPVCSLKFAFLGGNRIIDRSKLGLTELFSRVWTAGTKNLSEDEINHKIDFMAAGLSCYSGRNTVGLSAEFLSSFTDEMVSISKDVLCQPLWDQQILEREKLILTNQIQNQKDNPSQLCAIQFMKEIFKNHPYEREILGTVDTVKTISSLDLEKYHRDIFNRENIKICAVGDFDKGKLIDELNDLVHHMKNGSKQLKLHNVSPLNKDSLQKMEIKKEQTHIIVGYRGLKIGDKDKYVLEVIQSILSGQGGRLFLELRDKNSLAYSVSPIKLEGIETGYFGGYIGCSPEKTEKSIFMLKEEFKKLCENKLEEDELLRAKRYIVGRHDIDLQSKSAICNGILFDVVYDLDPDDIFNVTNKIFAVTAEDVQRVSQQIFEGHSVISIVGP